MVAEDFLNVMLGAVWMEEKDGAFFRAISTVSCQCGPVSHHIGHTQHYGEWVPSTHLNGPALEYRFMCRIDFFWLPKPVHINNFTVEVPIQHFAFCTGAITLGKSFLNLALPRGYPNRIFRFVWYLRRGPVRLFCISPTYIRSLKSGIFPAQNRFFFDFFSGKGYARCFRGSDKPPCLLACCEKSYTRRVLWESQGAGKKHRDFLDAPFQLQRPSFTP